MSDQKTYILRRIESFGIYDGNDKKYFGLPWIKIAIAGAEQIEGGIDTPYPELKFEEIFQLNDEKNREIRKVWIRISLKGAIMYRHEHSKIGDNLIYRYTFIYDSMSMISEVTETEHKDTEEEKIT